MWICGMKEDASEILLFVFFNDTATTEIYTYGHTLSLHDALPIYRAAHRGDARPALRGGAAAIAGGKRAWQLRAADDHRDRRHRAVAAGGVRAGAARHPLPPRRAGRPCGDRKSVL